MMEEKDPLPSLLACSSLKKKDVMGVGIFCPSDGVLEGSGRIPAAFSYI